MSELDLAAALALADSDDDDDGLIASALASAASNDKSGSMNKTDSGDSTKLPLEPEQSPLTTPGESQISSSPMTLEGSSALTQVDEEEHSSSNALVGDFGLSDDVGGPGALEERTVSVESGLIDGMGVEMDPESDLKLELSGEVDESVNGLNGSEVGGGSRGDEDTSLISPQNAFQIGDELGEAARTPRSETVMSWGGFQSGGVDVDVDVDGQPDDSAASSAVDSSAFTLNDSGVDGKPIFTLDESGATPVASPQQPSPPSGLTPGLEDLMGGSSGDQGRSTLFADDDDPADEPASTNAAARPVDDQGDDKKEERTTSLFGDDPGDEPASTPGLADLIGGAPSGGGSSSLFGDEDDEPSSVDAPPEDPRPAPDSLAVGNENNTSTNNKASSSLFGDEPAGQPSSTPGLADLMGGPSASGPSSLFGEDAVADDPSPALAPVQAPNSKPTSGTSSSSLFGDDPVAETLPSKTPGLSDLLGATPGGNSASLFEDDPPSQTKPHNDGMDLLDSLPGPSSPQAPPSLAQAPSSSPSPTEAAEAAAASPDEQPAVQPVPEKSLSVEVSNPSSQAPQVEVGDVSGTNGTQHEDANDDDDDDDDEEDDSLTAPNRMTAPEESLLQVAPVRIMTTSLGRAPFGASAGKPNTLLVSAGLALVGTTSGAVGAYSGNPPAGLRGILPPQSAAGTGAAAAVTALAASLDDEWIAVGTASGAIVLWDLTGSSGKGSVVKVITDYAPAGSGAVGYVSFVGTDRSKVVSTLVGSGVVYTHTISRWLVYRIDTQPMFDDGPETQWQAMAPLPVGSVPHVTDTMNIVALASRSKVQLIHMDPTPGKLTTIPRPATSAVGRSGALPYLAWRAGPTTAKTAKKSPDPVFAIGWGRSLQLFKVFASPGATMPLQKLVTNPASPSEGPPVPMIEFLPVGTFSLDAEVRGLQFLADQHLLFIHTDQGDIRVFDPFTSEEPARIPLNTGGDLLAPTLFTGLPEPPAKASDEEDDEDAANADPLAIASPAVATSGSDGPQPEPGCHSSICSTPAGVPGEGTVFMLSARAVHSASLLSAESRLQRAEQAGKWDEALSLALDLYNCRAKAPVGLPRDVDAVREIMSRRLPTIVHHYLDHALVHAPSSLLMSGDGGVKALKAYYRDVCRRVVYYLEAVGQTDVLFSDAVYGRVSGAGAKGAFLELLEPYILADKLTSLTPEVMKAFVEHYQVKGSLTVVEACITHMDIASLDFHQVVTLCREHALTSALIYVYNTGLMDYVSPVEELLKVASPESPEHADKLLAYLQFSLKGKAFPRGSPLPRDRAASVKEDLRKFLFGSEDRSSRLRVDAVLDLVPAEFLRVFEIMMTDESLPVQAPGGSGEVAASRQNMFDHVIPYLISKCESGSGEDMADAAGDLMMFISETASNGVLSVRPDVVTTCVEYLLKQAPDGWAHLQSPKLSDDARQEGLLGLIHSTSSSLELVPEDKLLFWAELAKFHRVTEVLYLRRGDYNKVVQAYLAGKGRHANEVFDLIRAIHGQASTDKDEGTVEAVRVATLENLEGLVGVDGAATGAVVLECFPRAVEEMTAALDAVPPVQFEYLRGILGRNDEIALEALKKAGVKISPSVHEAYIRLLCEFQTDAVARYLRSTDEYNLNFALELCRAKGLSEPVAYLLERSGDIGGALDALLSAVTRGLSQLQKVFDAQTGPIPEEAAQAVLNTPESEPVLKMVTRCVTLMSNHTEKLPRDESEPLWFRLLDGFVLPLRRLKTALGGDPTLSPMEQGAAPTSGSALTPEQRNGAIRMYLTLTYLIRTVLQSMLGHIRLPSVVQKIVSDHASDPLGEYKDLIRGMLESYEYESTLLNTANGLIEKDQFVSASTLVKKRAHAMRPRSMRCAICSRLVAQEPPSADTSWTGAIVFDCGDTFHRQCFHDALAAAGRESQSFLACPLCHSFSAPGSNAGGAGKAAGKAQRQGPGLGGPSKGKGRDTGLAMYATASSRLRAATATGQKGAPRASVGLNLAPRGLAAGERIGPRQPGFLPSQPKVRKTIG